MKLAIVDDLKTDSDRLAGFVHTYMEQHQLKLDALDQFESGESFLSGFTSGSYDLIFLDIYMTGITGMETAKTVSYTHLFLKIRDIEMFHMFRDVSESVHSHISKFFRIRHCTGSE